MVIVHVDDRSAPIRQQRNCVLHSNDTPESSLILRVKAFGSDELTQQALRLISDPSWHGCKRAGRYSTAPLILQFR